MSGLIVVPGIMAVPGHELAHDKGLQDQISAVLNRHYPNHVWQIHPDEDQGVVDIFNYAVSYHYGYRLLLETLYADPSLHYVMKAGGEILERGRLPRWVWDGEDAQRIDGIPEHQQPVGGIIIV